MKTESQKSLEAGLTPLLQQYKDLKAKNPHALLLFRCGDFYETFFEDAEWAARELQITLTARGKSGDNPVPLAGVPYHSAPAYIDKLVKKGITVAICEQMEDPKFAKGIVKREIVRVITPGTVTDPHMLDETSNNYLVAFGKRSGRFCLAAAELSTGEIIWTTGDNTEGGLLSEEFTRLSPKEILMLKGSEEEPGSLRPWRAVQATPHERKTTDSSSIESICAIFPNEHRSKIIGLPSLQLQTLGILADFLLDTQRCALKHLQFPVDYALGDDMVLDEATLRNLELLPDSREKSLGGNLFSVLNRTCTAMGARQFKRWLTRPLVKVEPIVKRQSLVGCFFEKPLLTASTREILKKTPDFERLLSKIMLGGRNPRDIQAMRDGLIGLPLLKKTIEDQCADEPGFAGLREISAELPDLKDLTELLQQHLRESLPANLADGGVIADGIDPELDELRSLLKDGDTWLAGFEEAEREATGIKTLKVRKNSVFGYYIEISKSLSDRAPEHYVRKQTLVNGERFITARLKEYETKVFSASDRSVAIEKRIYETLIEAVEKNITPVQKAASIVSMLDALAGLAHLAKEQRYIKPEVSADFRILIEGGRHPVVEAFLPVGEFHPNDTLLHESHRQAVITGPNMSGKSTYLRQVALITLLAQIGSFVPAAKASIGIVDRIFTRVGAFDNLVRGQSTFMVEMMETAAILRCATERSLLILDEIGRGTSTFDGLALAWSIIEHITGKLGARTLFATHYHELTELEEIFETLFNLNVGVLHDEQSGEMVFLHKIQQGPSSKSYGIEVARLAGVPRAVTDRAGEILFELEKSEQDEVGRVSRNVSKQKRSSPIQLTLFNPTNEVVEALKAVNINTLTPLEALNLLARFKEMANE